MGAEATGKPLAEGGRAVTMVSPSDGHLGQPVAAPLEGCGRFGEGKASTQEAHTQPL